MNAGLEASVRGLAGTALGLAVLLAGGCIEVGPDYTPPTRPMEAGYAEAGAKGTSSAADRQAVAWWNELHDPLLTNLIEAGVVANPTMRVAELRIQESRILLGEAYASLGPVLNASGSYTHSLPSRTVAGASTNGIHPRDLYQAGFDATWEIDIFGGVQRGIESAQAQAQGIDLDAANVRVSLAAEIARNYVLLRELQEQTQITQRNLKSQLATEDLTQSRIKAGLATDLDLTRISALAATTRAQLPVLTTQTKAAVHRIEVLLGRDPGSMDPELLAAGHVPAPPATIATGVPSELLRRRPDIREAERNIADLSARIGIATAQLYPQFSISGNLGLEARSGSLLSHSTLSQYWSFGPGISWPIFDWGRIRANIADAGVQEQEALVQYEQTVQGALEEVEDALVAYDRDQARRVDLQKAVSADERAVELSTELYSKGLTSFLDVLTAQQAQYEAESSLVSNEADITTDAVALYKAVGGGWQPAPMPEPTPGVAGAKVGEDAGAPKMFAPPAKP
ncbi:MAG: efflux transporter outer membrane subunit [Planctomycetota bacterium]